MQTPNIQITPDSATEYTKLKTSNISVADAVTLTSAVSSTVTSVLLSQGIWDVMGIVGWHSPNGATVPTHCTQGISLTSNTLSSTGTFTRDYLEVTIPLDPFYSTATSEITVDIPTSVYLIANSTFTSGNLQAYGSIRARRIY